MCSRDGTKIKHSVIYILIYSKRIKLLFSDDREPGCDKMASRFTKLVYNLTDNKLCVILLVNRRIVISTFSDNAV